MKSGRSRYEVIARVLITCLLTCVFFTQSTLILSAHHRIAHSPSSSVLAASVLENDSQICLSNKIGENKNNKSHLIHSDCCYLAQLLDSNHNPSDILKYAAQVDVLIPADDELNPNKAYEYLNTDQDIIGLKSSWSAQAPPLA